VSLIEPLWCSSGVHADIGVAAIMSILFVNIGSRHGDAPTAYCIQCKTGIYPWSWPRPGGLMAGAASFTKGHPRS
jgi:hypothetical protein